MLVFDNICVGLNYQTLEIAKGKSDPIMIEDQHHADDGGIIGLSLDQARWLRDNIDYLIKKFED